MTTARRTTLGLLAAGALLTGSAITGCAAASPDPAASGSSGDACEGVTLSYIGLEGEEGRVELEQWRDERGVQLESSWPGDFSQQIAAILTGQTFDLATIPYHQAQRMIASGALLPIDTDQLENWPSVAEGLRENPVLRGEDGAVYGAPIVWGDGPFIYSPERVPTPPASILDLVEPEWAGRFVLPDTPDIPFAYIAIAQGKDPVRMDAEELAEVAETAKALVANAAAFNTSYQDANDRLIAGDVDLALSGWEAQLTWAAERGVTLDYGFFEENRGGWWDGLAIPATADNPECALEYIDQMLSAEVQGQVATNLLSGTVNVDAIDLVGEEAQMYDYELVTNPEFMGSLAGLTPGEESVDGDVTFQDWLDAWQAIKAG